MSQAWHLGAKVKIYIYIYIYIVVVVVVKGTILAVLTVTV
jgi:hypothetical protein